MRSSRSLRRRITAAYVIIASVLCTVLGIASVVTIVTVEQELIRARLSAEFERVILHRQQDLPTELPVGMQLLESKSIPDGIRRLSPGFHEVTIEGKRLHILIRSLNSSNVFLADDQTQFEEFETDIFIALGLSIVASLMLAVLLGRLTASRVIAPLTELANAVEQNADSIDLPSVDATDEIGALARAFRKRTTQLDDFLMRERLFTGDVSHELRTPLTIVLNAAELLAVRLADNHELASIVERIRRTAADTAERVSALLLLSRSPDDVNVPTIPLQPVVEEEMARYKLLLVGKPVEMRLESAEEVWISGRRELVATAVGNLLRNACQYTEQGEIVVRLRSGELEVEDTGVGIPESLHERLFERFVSGSSDSVGSGLGLAIVKRVAEHLGGEIRHAKPSRGGSRFLLIFPQP